jgi:hypothetical protein
MVDGSYQDFFSLMILVSQKQQFDERYPFLGQHEQGPTTSG